MKNKPKEGKINIYTVGKKGDWKITVHNQKKKIK